MALKWIILVIVVGCAVAQDRQTQLEKYLERWAEKLKEITKKHDEAVKMLPEGEESSEEIREYKERMERLKRIIQRVENKMKEIDNATSSKDKQAPTSGSRQQFHSQPEKYLEIWSEKLKNLTKKHDDAVKMLPEGEESNQQIKGYKTKIERLQQFIEKLKTRMNERNKAGSSITSTALERGRRGNNTYQRPNQTHAASESHRRGNHSDQKPNQSHHEKHLQTLAEKLKNITKSHEDAVKMLPEGEETSERIKGYKEQMERLQQIIEKMKTRLNERNNAGSRTLVALERGRRGNNTYQRPNQTHAASERDRSGNQPDQKPNQIPEIKDFPEEIKKKLAESFKHEGKQAVSIISSLSKLNDGLTSDNLETLKKATASFRETIKNALREIDLATKARANLTEQ